MFYFLLSNGSLWWDSDSDDVIKSKVDVQLYILDSLEVRRKWNQQSRKPGPVCTPPKHQLWPETIKSKYLQLDKDIFERLKGSSVPKASAHWGARVTAFVNACIMLTRQPNWLRFLIHHKPSDNYNKFYFHLKIFGGLRTNVGMEKVKNINLWAHEMYPWSTFRLCVRWIGGRKPKRLPPLRNRINNCTVKNIILLIL